MATTVGTEKNPIDLFNSLIELDYDAIEAYKAAIDRVEDANDKAKLREFMADHQQHVTDLSFLVRAMGGEPKREGDIKQLLTKGKVVLAGLIGDRVVLGAMKTNEDDTNEAYERAVQHAGVTEEARRVLEKNLGDERRHRAWIEERLKEKESKTELKKGKAA